MVDPKTGYPTNEFLRNLNSNIDLANYLADIQAATVAAQAAAEAAQIAADNAQTAADNAATAGDATALEQSINASYPTNYSPPLLTADPTGGVNIVAHDRVYGNPTLNPTVTVFAGSVATGFAPGDIARVYYDDPDRSGGLVTYQATLDPAVAAQTGNRHSVGAIEIPPTGTGEGRPTLPPGGVQYENAL